METSMSCGCRCGGASALDAPVQRRVPPLPGGGGGHVAAMSRPRGAQPRVAGPRLQPQFAAHARQALPVHVPRLLQDVRQVLAPQGARAAPHGGETVRVHVAGLWLALLPLGRAGAPPSLPRRRQAVPLRRLRQTLHPLRSPRQAPQGASQAHVGRHQPLTSWLYNPEPHSVSRLGRKSHVPGPIVSNNRCSLTIHLRDSSFNFPNLSIIGNSELSANVTVSL